MVLYSCLLLPTEWVECGTFVIPFLSAFPMCADAQTANLLSRKLIRSRSLDGSANRNANLEVASQAQ